MTSTDSISTDQKVGGCCQNESDPATCVLGDLGTFPSAIRKTSKRDVDPALNCLMCWHTGELCKNG